MPAMHILTKGFLCPNVTMSPKELTSITKKFEGNHITVKGRETRENQDLQLPHQ
jgi:hypothetical protein